MKRILLIALVTTIALLGAASASASYWDYDMPAAYWGNADYYGGYSHSGYWYDDADYRAPSTWCAWCDYPYYQRPIVITNYPTRGYGGYASWGHGYYGWDTYDRRGILYPGYAERFYGYNRYY